MLNKSVGHSNLWTLCKKRAKHFIWRQMEYVKILQLFVCLLLLNVAQILYTTIADAVLFFEASNPSKSSYDAWDSTV